MGPKEYILIGVGALLALFILIILIRALAFKDKTNYRRNVPFNGEKDDIVNKLGELLKYKTISHENEEETDYKVFDEYIKKTKELYPLVFKACECTITKEHAIKLKLNGKSSLKPSILIAHYDVVPVTEGWSHDPFLGEVVDGYLYGRGAVDTKLTMACALSALEKALEKGYVPNNDLYLCFGANEEINGDSQLKLVQEFKKEGIRPAFVFDEGGGIMNSAFPGVKKDTAFLGMVEKGFLNVKLSIDSNGGHSSTPKKNGPIIRMSKALAEIEKNPMKPNITPTVKELLRIMGMNTIFPLKLVFANMWLFKGLVKKLFSQLSADTRALLTSTFAFTTINGGNQTNVIPNHVEANINIRIAPFDTAEAIVKHIRKVVKDKNIMITYENVNKMYPECSFKSEGYNLIKETIIETYDDTIVSPFIMLGGTDGRHYNEICDCVIRFTPAKLTKEERAGVHGLNEKIKVESLEKCLEFYQRLLEKI